MKDFSVRDLFFIDKMITPSVITFIYWLVLLGLVIGGFITMIGGYFVLGLLIIVTGFVYARIMFEVILVFFKINENIKKLVDKDTK